MDTIIEGLFPEGFFTSGKFKEGFNGEQLKAAYGYIVASQEYREAYKALAEDVGPGFEITKFTPNTTQQRELLNKFMDAHDKMRRTELSGFDQDYAVPVIEILAKMAGKI
jgi:hypothetical protein